MKPFVLLLLTWASVSHAVPLCLSQVQIKVAPPQLNIQLNVIVSESRGRERLILTDLSQPSSRWTFAANGQKLTRAQAYQKCMQLANDHLRSRYLAAREQGDNPGANVILLQMGSVASGTGQCVNIEAAQEFQLVDGSSPFGDRIWLSTAEENLGSMVMESQSGFIYYSWSCNSR